MKKSLVCVPTLCLVLSAGCASMSINTDFDPQTDFSGFTTYGWMSPPESPDPRINNSLLDSRVHVAVDSVMREKGYRLTGSGNADILIGYQAALEGKLDVTTVNRYYGYRWGRVAVRDVSVRSYDEGTLILDIAERSANRLIWRGMAQAEVNLSATPEQRQRKISEAVGKMLARFPPN